MILQETSVPQSTRANVVSCHIDFTNQITRLLTLLRTGHVAGVQRQICARNQVKIYRLDHVMGWNNTVECYRNIVREIG